MSIHDELLCIADTKLVMGNWLATTVMNGRCLPDFAAILGMCTTSYGQTRTIYQFLADGYEEYAELERGRGRGEIRSMNLLDAPPLHWEDLVLTIWLAEQATWTMASGFLSDPDQRVAALARRIGEEAYFHFKYASGWFPVLAGDDGARERLASVLSTRLPLALDWFGAVDDVDPLHEAGQRECPVAALRESFLAGVTEEMKGVGILVQPGEPATIDEWRPEARRRGPLPEGLFEVIRFKDETIAH